MNIVKTGRPRHPDPVGESTFERPCPQCGKVFLCYNTREWCYRMGEKVFCSWTCYRERERHVPPHTGGRVERDEDARRHNQHYKKDKALEQTRRIIEMKAAGMSNGDIAQEIGITTYVVASRLQRYGKQLGWVPLTKSQAGLQGVARKAAKKKERMQQRSLEK